MIKLIDNHLLENKIRNLFSKNPHLSKPEFGNFGLTWNRLTYDDHHYYAVLHQNAVTGFIHFYCWENSDGTHYIRNLAFVNFKPGRYNFLNDVMELCNRYFNDGYTHICYNFHKENPARKFHYKLAEHYHSDIISNKSNIVTVTLRGIF